MMRKRILQLCLICCDHSGMNILARRYLLCKSQMKSLRCCLMSYFLPLLLRFRARVSVISQLVFQYWKHFPLAWWAPRQACFASFGLEWDTTPPKLQPHGTLPGRSRALTCTLLLLPSVLPIPSWAGHYFAVVLTTEVLGIVVPSWKQQNQCTWRSAFCFALNFTADFGDSFVLIPSVRRNSSTFQP